MKEKWRWNALATAALELIWDRDATDAATPSQHVLRVRITPAAAEEAIDGLPLCLAIALDTSMSMSQEERIERARQACLAVAERLRPQDRLYLAGFGTDVRELLSGQPGGEAALMAISEKISLLEPFGVTRTDLALGWLLATLSKQQNCVREAILITDGHVTTPQGYPLIDTEPLVQQAKGFAEAGITLSTLGLGNAQNFNTDFLTRLSEGGIGSFMYAAEPAQLAALLSQRFRRAQHMGLSAATLVIRPASESITVRSACRMRPDYVAGELGHRADGGLTLLAGALEQDSATDFLLRIAVPAHPLGTPGESIDVLSISLHADGREVAAASAPQIEYTASYTRRQQFNAEVDRDRQLWEMNEYARELQRSANPRQTAMLLENIENSAFKAGAEDIAQQAAAHLRSLRETGVLTRHNATALLSQAIHKGEEQ